MGSGVGFEVQSPGLVAKDQTSPTMPPHPGSNKFTGDPPKRDNYRRALPDALAQAGLSAEERAALDAAEKEELIKEKYLVDKIKQEHQDQIQEVLAKRKRNKLKELVSGIDLN